MMQEQHTDWQVYFEKMRYKLVLHLCYFFIVLMTILSVVNGFNAHFSAWPNVLAVVMCVIGVVMLKRTGNYFLVGAFCSVISLGIISSAFSRFKRSIS